MVKTIYILFALLFAVGILFSTGSTPSVTLEAAVLTCDDFGPFDRVVIEPTANSKTPYIEPNDGLRTKVIGRNVSDWVRFYGGGDCFEGNGGNDYLLAYTMLGQDPTVAFGGAGQDDFRIRGVDNIWTGGGPAIFYGGSGGDHLVGGGSNDYLNGEAEGSWTQGNFSFFGVDYDVCVSAAFTPYCEEVQP